MTRSDRWIGALFFLFGLWVVWQASRLEFASSYGAGSGFFPYWLGITIALIAALVVAAAWHGSHAMVAPHLSAKKIAAFAALLVFVPSVEFVGFISAFTCLAAFFLRLEGESWLKALSIAIVSGAGFHLFFVRLLSVTLPVGPLGF
jgi:hypothetical protein